MESSDRLQHEEDMFHLILLPGLDGTGNLFDPLLSRLSHSQSTVVVRYPGDCPLDYDGLAVRALEQIPKSGNLVILAESFSGPVAITLVPSLGARLKGIIFCCTFAACPRPMLLKAAALLPLSYLMRLSIPDWLIRILLLGPHAEIDSIARLRLALSKVSPTVLASRIRMLATVDMRGAISSINFPCCYLQAAADRLVPRGCVRPFEKSLPNFELLKIEGSHLLLQSRPEESAQAIKRFIWGLAPLS